MLKIGMNEAAKHYNLLTSFGCYFTADRRHKKYNKINGLKEVLSALYLQKYTLDQACSHQSQALIALAKLKSNGITEHRILQLNSFLEKNGMKELS